MNFSINSWPAAIVLTAAILAAAAVLVTLSWHDPRFAMGLAGSAGTCIAALLPHAIARSNSTSK